MRSLFAVALIFFFLGAMFERFVVSVDRPSPVKNKVFSLIDRATQKEILSETVKKEQLVKENASTENNFLGALEMSSSFQDILYEEVEKNYKAIPVQKNKKFPHTRIENKFKSWNLDGKDKSKWFKTTFNQNLGSDIEFTFFFEAYYCGDDNGNKKNNNEEFINTQCFHFRGYAKHRERWFSMNFGANPYSLSLKNDVAYFEIQTNTRDIDFFKNTGIALFMIPIPGEQARIETLYVNNNQLKWDEGDDIEYVVSSKKEADAFYEGVKKEDPDNY